MSIAKALTHIQFEGFCPFDFSRGFRLISENDEMGISRQKWHKRYINLTHHLLVIVRTIWFVSLKPFFQKSELGEIVFVLAPPGVQHRRKDIAQMYDKVRGLTNGCDGVLLEQHTGHEFRWTRTKKLLHYTLSWWQNMHATHLSVREKLRIVRELITLHDFSCIMETLPDYKLAIVFYDANLYNNYFVCYAKQKGCKTATLQHGVMVAARPEVHDNIDFKGIEFDCFVSDYFLAWNNFTYREAVRSGMEDRRIRILGIAKCIGKTRKATVKGEIKRLGVLLDGKFSDVNNGRLARVVDEYCQRYSKHYILKYHPAYKGNEFENLLSSCGKQMPITATLDELIAQTDGIVVSNSTALFELAYLGVPFFRFKSEPLIDKFRDLHIPMFSDSLELSSLVSSYEAGKYLIDTKELCGTSESVENTYRKFLEEFFYEKYAH